jgi:hypothetical protein
MHALDIDIKKHLLDVKDQFEKVVNKKLPATTDPHLLYLHLEQLWKNKLL